MKCPLFCYITLEKLNNSKLFQGDTVELMENFRKNMDSSKSFLETGEGCSKIKLDLVSELNYNFANDMVSLKIEKFHKYDVDFNKEKKEKEKGWAVKANLEDWERHEELRKVYFKSKNI